MSRQVRRLSLVFALLMVAVLVNITLIQVVNAGDGFAVPVPATRAGGPRPKTAVPRGC